LSRHPLLGPFYHGGLLPHAFALRTILATGHRDAPAGGWQLGVTGMNDHGNLMWDNLAWRVDIAAFSAFRTLPGIENLRGMLLLR